MSTVTGQRAEQAAVGYLQRLGYRTLQQNWRTRWCEIDLVVYKEGCIRFVEVKYRARNHQGSGLNYITPAKLGQMQFAAQFWMAKYARSEWEYSLSAIEVGGDTFEVTAWLDEL